MRVCMQYVRIKARPSSYKLLRYHYFFFVTEHVLNKYLPNNHHNNNNWHATHSPHYNCFGIHFSHGRKPRSNYRRPSSLGLANTPLPDQSEASQQFTPLASGRSHIVAPLKDHLRPEGSFEKTSEASGQYRNLSPCRPVIHKLKDTLKVRI